MIAAAVCRYLIRNNVRTNKNAFIVVSLNFCFDRRFTKLAWPSTWLLLETIANSDAAELEMEEHGQPHQTEQARLAAAMSQEEALGDAGVAVRDREENGASDGESLPTPKASQQSVDSSSVGGSSASSSSSSGRSLRSASAARGGYSTQATQLAAQSPRRRVGWMDANDLL